MPAAPAPTPNTELENAQIFSLTGKGLTSKQQITVSARRANAGSGITFNVLNPKTGEYVEMKAATTSVVNTMRNVVLGKDGVRLCIVEHFLAAAVLWGFEDLIVDVDGPEMPLGDGSADMWTAEFEKAGIPKVAHEATIELKEPIVISKGDRMLMALPDQKFSLNYMMDWDHPLIGKRWQSWDSTKDINDIASARTFGLLKEHQMLGLADDVVSITPDGFSMPLRFEDEPVRHKILDLLGDLALIGINPMRVKARFISIKGGHEMDVDLAKRLVAVL